MSDNLIVVGRFGAVHGVQGDIRVLSFTEHPLNLLEYLPWQIMLRGKPQAIEILQHKLHGEQIVVKIKDYDNRELAKTLTNQDIYIRRDQLPTLEDDEIYWSDLVGLKVVDQRQQTLGTIKSIENYGASDLIILAESDVILPYIDDVVLNVDMEQGVMQVHWEVDED